jgi:rsbT antagonist protein RsbS
MTDALRLPVIKLWKQVVVPLQGDISDVVADRLREQVLETLRDSDAQGLIIDVTGVWMVDSHLCSVLSNMAGSARLMGSECVICGMSAEIALTLQAMDIDLSGIHTALGLEEAFAHFGIRPTLPTKKERAPNANGSAAPSTAPAERRSLTPFGVTHGRLPRRT